MFRIRRIYDNNIPINREAIRQVQAILRVQFPSIKEKEIEDLPKKLQDPLKYRFRTVLFVADNPRGNVQGFALLMHAPDLDFSFLDFISTLKTRMGGGVGSAIYERAREEAFSLDAKGLFFECLPDEPKLCPDPQVRRVNANRLRFYEEFGARPIVNTEYETPVGPADDLPPFLVVDNLGRSEPLRRDHARAVVRAILERKYPRLCPREYIERVVSSFNDDPVMLREPRYIKDTPISPPPPSPSYDKQIILVVNDKHDIHHVRERGYVESPIRISSILKEIQKTGLFTTLPPAHFGDRYILSVHKSRYLDYFRKACANLASGESIYPYVFPIRNQVRPPKELSLRAGYFCIDTFTPINGNAYLAARRAVDCTLTAADTLLQGHRMAYALVRPPGHHAGKEYFGGFCYMNSVAIAARYLSYTGKVAILDVDYHHGNGQQDIFYDSPDVLTVSIHAHPKIAYPYFSGYENETGEGPGVNFNLNIPLQEEADGERYRQALGKALRRIHRFSPTFLIVALGLDTAKGDPTGSWSLGTSDFESNGRMMGQMSLPTLVVQEGGYKNRVLGKNARHFFRGLWDGMYIGGSPKGHENWRRSGTFA